jgi:hypothetical protein
MNLRLALLLTATAALLARSGAARACGGGVVTTTEAGTVGADAQRILISVRGEITDVITQIGVPRTTADYGVLIPVPGEPTLDTTPVASADIDKLFARTAPRIVVRASDGGDDGIGCAIGCGSGATKGGIGDPLPGGAQVSEPVTIGPVTAVTLTADTGDAVNAWLGESGFALSAEGQALVAAYAGAGRYFIAIRRSTTAATGAPTSVGVHFTLAGDQRGLPLRFARLGAGVSVGFTVLVAADAVVAPSPPFAALTLTDLDPAQLRGSGYAGALAVALADHGHHAFVIEGTWTSATLMNDSNGWPSLRPFIAAGQAVTRLSTLVPAAALDTDVVFDQPFTGPVPEQVIVQRTAPREQQPRLALGAVLLALAAVASRRPRR